MRPYSLRQRRIAFTLVEMLVVIGIITLLVGILLPVLTKVRRSSTNAKCLNNLREIGMAMSQYLDNNDHTLPTAVSANCWDEPASPRGHWERPKEVGGGDHKVQGALPPVAYYLDSYLKYDIRPWICPASKVLFGEPEGQMRLPQLIRSNAVHVKDQPDDMWTGLGFWRPGYMFLSAHGWGWYQDYDVVKWAKYGMIEWKVRNVSGLHMNELTTTTKQSADAIVLFYDYSSRHHSKSAEDVYDLPQQGGNVSGFMQAITRGQFQSNFLFLDGHVETRHYEWQGGLLNVIHRPIPQSWSGVDYTKKYAASYTAPRYPD